MRPFQELVREACEAEVDGWGFRWLDGRATEERPPWGYARLMAGRLAAATSALDLETGGGEVLDEAPVLPPTMRATEAWPPNLAVARHRLGPRGVEVADTSAVQGLPFADETFDLVTSRHPVSPDWPEIHRVLRPEGTYLAQHVGPASAFELIEHFLGPQPEARRHRHPDREAEQARDAGLEIRDLRTARCRLEFHDVGAVIWILRKCPWWVPGFQTEDHMDRLRALDRQMRAGRPVVAHSTRHLIEAVRPAQR
ncbi:class I SAM-dependent methyltransferase [Nesterenkonia sp. K-15-9-6]|uniref:class I SAM-dependent methyltransferase n=1 Tax=Nesterenkonia sp. K-15-9-6 TaxID=3093918 RepID=UPI004044BD96